MVAHLKASLKPLDIIVLLCSRGFQGGPQLVPMMPGDASPSDSCSLIFVVFAVGADSRRPKLSEMKTAGGIFVSKTSNTSLFNLIAI